MYSKKEFIFFRRILENFIEEKSNNKQIRYSF